MEPKKILLVDDNIELAENLSEILTESGFEVAVFHNPLQALAAFVPGVYALALLDIIMPGMDGIELYRRLKEKDPSLPAIALTAYANDDRVTAAMKEGVLVVFSKPLDIARLLTEVSSTFSKGVILIVEDDLALAQNLAEIFLLRGLSPRIAGSCGEARVLYRVVNPKVALIDWQLPDGSGADLAQEFCQGDQKQGCLTVLFSGFFRDSLPEDDPGRLVFFEKPLPIEQFLRTITAQMPT